MVLLRVASKAFATVSKKMVNIKPNMRMLATYHKQHQEKPDDFRKFNVKTMKKNYEVIPLVGTVVVAICGVVFFVIYHATHVTEVRYSKSGQTIEESMNVLKPKVSKMMVVQQEYRPMTELKEALTYKNEKPKEIPEDETPASK
jgi:membrane protein insertase Oxa1/YidC/SpoIIIJ